MNTSSDGPSHRLRNGHREPARSAEPDMFAQILNGFSIGRRADPDPVPDEPTSPTEEPASAAWPAAETASAPTHEPPPPAEPPLSTHIRPYAWTGGRTTTRHTLELETLVSTSEPGGALRAQRVEHDSVAALCQHPRSVAEVGALLNVPVGVTRVLLGDMADLGLLTVHETVIGGGTAAHLQLMERVLSGLRKL